MMKTQRVATSPAALEAGLRLGRLMHDECEIREAIRDAVQQCRDLGLSWSQIGIMLGTSPQAAWERYAQKS